MELPQRVPQDVAGVDVYGYTANDFQITDEGWREGVAVTAGFGMAAASWVLERLAGEVRTSGAKDPGRKQAPTR